MSTNTKTVQLDKLDILNKLNKSDVLLGLEVDLSKLPSYTRAEVRKHNKVNDCWIIIDGIIVDVTKYALIHPGGQSIFYDLAGKDGTEEFNHKYHSNDAYEIMIKHAIGLVKSYI